MFVCVFGGVVGSMLAEAAGADSAAPDSPLPGRRGALKYVTEPGRHVSAATLPATQQYVCNTRCLFTHQSTIACIIHHTIFSAGD